MESKCILITGGAGYIGSHVLKQLLSKTAYTIVVVDNLSTGSLHTIHLLKNIREFTFIEIDLKNFNEINNIIMQNNIDTILHFAASIVVPESVVDPLQYYFNNTINTTFLIKASINSHVKKFIFSSTAAVYGEPKEMPIMGIDESYIANPINPYGKSKLMSEQILIDLAKVNPQFKYIIFRYFNVAGADMETPVPRIGQCFPNATHLIKITAECAVGKRKEMSIFGDNYATPDGTGVRDYIHVDDLARAHVDAIEYLEKNPSDIFNVGYGKGYSVKEVIDEMHKVSLATINTKIAQKREGDIAILIANNTKIRNKMKWVPLYNDLSLICKSAFDWEKTIKIPANFN